jgi:hypothetical protein
MLRQAEEVAHRIDAPDYVVIVNEKMAAQQMLEMLAQSPAKVFLMHNDLTLEQRRETGNERERIGNWIGTATTDAARGGYLLMQDLYRQLGQREARVVGITGDPNTPVSLERAEGVKHYVFDAEARPDRSIGLRRLELRRWRTKGGRLAIPLSGHFGHLGLERFDGPGRVARGQGPRRLGSGGRNGRLGGRAGERGRRRVGGNRSG